MTATTPQLSLHYASDSDFAQLGNSQIQTMAQDLDAFYGAEGTWTPTIKQSASLTFTFTRQHFKQKGKWVEFDLMATYSSGAGTINNAIMVSLPVPSRAGATTPLSVGIPVGQGYIFDSSAATRYHGLLTTNTVSTNNFEMVLILPAGIAGLSGSNFNAVFAASDTIRYWGAYEA